MILLNLIIFNRKTENQEDEKGSDYYKGNQEAEILDKNDLWVLFKVADNMYAASSSCIEGISMVPEQITEVPEAMPYVRGIVKQRGKIITLIDLRKAFGVENSNAGEAFAEDGPAMMIIIKREGKQRVALIVDEIDGVEPIGEIYQDTVVDKISRSELVGGVASSLSGDQLLLLIDEKEINQLFCDNEAQEVL